MIVIVAGSRTITDYALVKAAIEDSGFGVTLLLSGMARPRKQENYQPSVDLLGVRWAEEHGIRYVPMSADWGKFGKSAGMIRNFEMAEFAAKYCNEGGALVAIIENRSSGSENMVEEADNRGLALFVRRYETGVGLVKETRITKTSRTDVDCVSSVGWLDLGK